MISQLLQSKIPAEQNTNQAGMKCVTDLPSLKIPH